ncbi:hypothetical protein [Chitinophaga filiformis]|uniref:Natural product n=1 Tax=Chitinophaga filiformis TaxID=104663 RepID=A0ABY4I121_CHIFI|nr:hypothetical protein [Chitinophaga filiformis]UPK68984.1 hypothetical protein MYF79_28910 [Chitinophaga filiformis]
MKRFVTILLAFLYVTLTGGFTVNADCRAGKLSSVDFTSHTGDDATCACIDCYPFYCNEPSLSAGR